MESFFRVSEYEVVDSTNDTVMRMAQNGEPEGFVAVAKRQTSGRGRMGREFFSPDGGLYMSVLFRPRVAPEKVRRITTIAAVAVCEAIEVCSGKSAEIKWVNDVIVDARKVCGILTQSSVSQDGAVDCAVLGIGVNIAAPEGGFPDDIKRKAGAVYGEDCPAGAREAIMKSILERLYYYYKRMESSDYAREYARRSLLTGRRVDVIAPPRPPVSAKVLGVDEECGLMVEYENGERETLSSGEVGVRYDYE